MTDHRQSDEHEGKAPRHASALAALQALAGMAMTTVLIPTIIGRSAGLADHEIRWILFATLVSAAVIAMLQPLRLGRLGSGLAMLGGASPAFIGVAGVALASGGPPLLSMMTLCSLPAAFVFVRYAHRMRRVLQPVVMGTIIMLVASSLANVVWRLTQQPLEAGQDTWISPAIFAGTFLSILLVSIFAGPRLRLWAPLIGLGIGLTLSSFTGTLAPAALGDAEWFGLPDMHLAPPSVASLPMFLALLPSFVILQVVVSMESYSCGRLAQSLYGTSPHELDNRTYQGAVLANGVGTLTAGLLGAMPTTTYSSSVSVIGLTGVTSPSVGFWAAGMLAILALSPTALTLIALIPPAVASGYLLFIVVVMFGNGMRMATQNGLNRREGLIVISGFWIGLSLQAGIFHDHFGGAHLLVQSAGTSIGGLLAILLVGILYVHPRGQMRSTITLSDGGYQDLHALALRFAASVQAQPELVARLLLACEEALHLMATLDAERSSGPRSDKYGLTFSSVGKSVAVELIALPTPSDLYGLSSRAERTPSEIIPEERLELAGIRVLKSMTHSVSYSKYQDADILSFVVKPRG